MQKYYVNTDLLNVRSTPSSKTPDNIVSRLQKYRIVGVEDKLDPYWWRVLYTEGGKLIEGHVAARFLEGLSDPLPSFSGVGDVHYERDPLSKLSSKGRLFKPMGDLGIPFRSMGSVDSRIQSVHGLVRVLDVSNSLRYQRTERHTFCNIYAYDLCYFSRAYLPRVWWYPQALKKLAAGEHVEVSYGETVREMNANSLHDWLVEWGDDFGWARITASPDAFQGLVNRNGGIGLICARRRDRSRSGHITVVLPETGQIRAARANGRVLCPLQTQAGAVNLRYFSSGQGAWWTSERFDSFGLYFHE